MRKFRRMSSQGFLVDIRAPAGPLRHGQYAILDHGNLSDEIVFPRHVINIGFHDREIRYDRRQVRAHHRREMTVKIVRRAVDLVGVGHRRNLDRLRQPIPGHVDNCHVDRAVFEEWPILPAPKERLAGSDRHPGAIAYETQPLGVIRVNFQPSQIERLANPRDLDISICLEIEIHIEMQSHFGPGALAKSRQGYRRFRRARRLRR